eukprot:CAMPEP_0172395356 /NCGR_PEP_ID=MMETSP1061-20121228/19186_1 /TAXON_ID=37318 /ORGANISM="Pseudo-nitzschia pungens, Strain cf. pungens" /LENGTH=697 /DNA_ID=CAMNT_0013126901 /DNA_START=51 /DNA_END=2144 /DNA_ORIENTATION=+
MTEVGVSLALRRHRSLIRSKDEKTSNASSNNTGSKRENVSEKRKRLRSSSLVYSPFDTDDDSHDNNGVRNREGSYDRSKRKSKSKPRIKGESLPSYSSWRVLFEGAVLYIFCMILPNIVRVTLRLIQSFWRETGTILYQIAGYICSRSWLLEYKICRNFLPENIVDDLSPNSSVLAPDAGISDLAIVILLSISMAVTRVALVHLLVPNYKQPKRLEALVRCKSIHLLSSSYSGSVTPTKVMRLKSFDRSPMNELARFQIPDLNSGREDESSDDSYGQHKDTGNDYSIEVRPRFPSDPLSDLQRPKMLPGTVAQEERMGKNKHEGGWLFHDDSSTNGYDDEDESHFQAPAVSSGLLTSNSAQNLQALLEQAAPPASTIALQRENGQSKKKEKAERIFAAPKYATAVFRLIFCLVSCSIGFCYFRAADFWPPAVGGTGSTSNCWDLSSIGVTLMHKETDKIVDSDFDSYNSSLRRYYLIQASYHFHSAAFHILTSMLLWFVSKSSKKKESSAPRFFGFIPMSMFTLYNVRIFLQHIFSLALILGTYLFSSTRRLGAIAMFSFDASSLFLHLLQLGINAPQKQGENPGKIGFLRKSNILILHRFLVIPAFCYARFYVFPFVVGYSALEESQDWLHQLQNMLTPGAAKFIHGFFVIAFVLFMLMNLVYFGRLLNHPHVMYAMEKQKGGNAKINYGNESEIH